MAKKMQAARQIQLARDISKAAELADRLILYDNSTNAGHQIIATVEGDRSVIYVQELPEWMDRSI
jgi:predicted ABC-type ATPase